MPILRHIVRLFSLSVFSNYNHLAARSSTFRRSAARYNPGPPKDRFAVANRGTAELQTNVRLSSLAVLITLLLAATASVQSVHAAVSDSSAASKDINARKSARVEFSASRQCVGGREIAGFSARQARTAQEQKLIPPVALKPVEQEAWLAMARRQGASGGMGLASFYPKRYGEGCACNNP
jgi:hypothetical protein